MGGLGFLDPTFLDPTGHQGRNRVLETEETEETEKEHGERLFWWAI